MSNHANCTFWVGFLFSSEEEAESFIDDLPEEIQEEIRDTGEWHGEALTLEVFYANEEMVGLGQRLDRIAYRGGFHPDILAAAAQKKGEVLKILCERLGIDRPVRTWYACDYS